MGTTVGPLERPGPALGISAVADRRVDRRTTEHLPACVGTSWAVAEQTRQGPGRHIISVAAATMSSKVPVKVTVHIPHGVEAVCLDSASVPQAPTQHPANIY